MPELIALFDFEVLEPKSEEERYGEGSIKIDTDREPKTQEDFNDIARAIFKRGGYAQVAVKKVFYDDDNLFEALAKPTEEPKDQNLEEFKLDAAGDTGILDDHDVIVGEIVDE